MADEMLTGMGNYWNSGTKETYIKHDVAKLVCWGNAVELQIHDVSE